MMLDHSRKSFLVVDFQRAVHCRESCSIYQLSSRFPRRLHCLKYPESMVPRIGMAQPHTQVSQCACQLGVCRDVQVAACRRPVALESLNTQICETLDDGSRLCCLGQQRRVCVLGTVAIRHMQPSQWLYGCSLRQNAQPIALHGMMGCWEHI